MLDLLQLTVDGLLDGAAYALVGFGLALTFGTLRRLNLAYGASAMLAAYIGSWLFQRHGTPWWTVLPVVVVSAVVIGFYVERLCFAGLGEKQRAGASRASGFDAGRDGYQVVALASSFAIWMQLEQLATLLLPRHLNPFPSLAAGGEWELGPVAFGPDRLALALLAVGFAFALHRWLHGTRGGLAWRATSDHATAAHLSGIPVVRVQVVAFAAASAMAGMAAFALLSIDGQVTPMFGMWVLIKGLAAAMIGGLAAPTGVLAGGLLLGVVEAHAQGLGGALARDFATYALVFAVLLWRPQGLLGRPAQLA